MHPAKTVGRKMSFVRDTRVVPSNIVLDRGAGPHGKGDFYIANRGETVTGSGIVTIDSI